MKIKVAFGTFVGHSGGTSKCKPNITRLTDSSKDAVINITNRCKVHGVFFFNAADDEKVVELVDVGDVSADYVTMNAAPKIYQTVVPRDAAFKHTWTIASIPYADIEFDIYDTPTGIYDTFPKPGFLFENGVTVHNTTAGANAELFWVIFYSE